LNNKDFDPNSRTKIDHCFNTESQIRFIADYNSLEKIAKIYRYVRDSGQASFNLQVLDVAIKLMDQKYHGIGDKRSRGSGSPQIENGCAWWDKFELSEFLILMKEYLKVIERNKSISSNFPDSILGDSHLPIIFYYKSICVCFRLIDISGEPKISFIMMDFHDKLKLVNFEEKNQFKNLMLRTITHELNTPLNYISDFTMNVIEFLENKIDLLLCDSGTFGDADIQKIAQGLSIEPEKLCDEIRNHTQNY
jgi:hypothetical protein